MVAAMKVAVAVFLVVASTAFGVSAQTHHVVGGENGWGPDLDVTSWLSGRVFSVGDKIWLKKSGGEETIMEVGGVEEFASCNLTNPLRMYTDRVNDVVLDKEGIRYFISGNPDKCKKGLKLPVPVQPHSDDQFDPGHISPPFHPGHISPPFDPSYDPSPPFEPYPPVKPTPPTPPHEPPPVRTPPPPQQPKPVHPPPSAAPPTHLSSFIMLSPGFLLCYFLRI